MKISFAGCGFLGVYHIGVAKCIVEMAPQFADSLEGYYGTSAGSLVAVMLCCRVGVWWPASKILISFRMAFCSCSTVHSLLSCALAMFFLVFQEAFPA